MLPDRLARDDFSSEVRALEGRIALVDMPRLASLLLDTAGSVWLRIEARLDLAGRRFLEGEIQAQLALTCQRCLSTYHHSVDERFRVAVVASDDEEVERLPQEQEAFVTSTDDCVSLAHFAEEELLLLLPVTPRHLEGACAAPESDVTLTPQERSPFAVLKGRFGP